MSSLVLVSVCALFVAPGAVSSQVLYGSIIGNVTDNTGAALPGATVTITQGQTNTSRETITDDTGTYRFSTVQPGLYTVVVKMQGFGNATRPDVSVSLNSIARVDMALQIGQLAESVTVEASTPLLQTDRAEVRAELNAQQLQNLPVPKV